MANMFNNALNYITGKSDPSENISVPNGAPNINIPQSAGMLATPESRARQIENSPEIAQDRQALQTITDSTINFKTEREQQNAERLAEETTITTDALTSAHIASHEGYLNKNSVGQYLSKNVPNKKSGVTIGGFDIAKGDSSLITPMKNLIAKDPYFNTKDIGLNQTRTNALNNLFNNKNRIKKHDAARNTLSSLGLDDMYLSRETLEAIPALGLPTYKKRVTNKIGEQNYKSLPEAVKTKLVSLNWLHTGPASLGYLKDFLEAKPKDKANKLKIVLKEYDNYWSAGASDGHVKRTDEVAAALRAAYPDFL